MHRLQLTGTYIPSPNKPSQHQLRRHNLGTATIEGSVSVVKKTDVWRFHFLDRPHSCQNSTKTIRVLHASSRVLRGLGQKKPNLFFYFLSSCSLSPYVCVVLFHVALLVTTTYADMPGTRQTERPLFARRTRPWRMTMSLETCLERGALAWSRKGWVPTRSTPICINWQP